MYLSQILAGYGLARLLLRDDVSEERLPRGIFTMIYYITRRRFTMSEQGKQVAKVAAMLAGGAILGAGLGLLFAPKAGAQTRRDISRYAKKAQVQALRLGRSVQSGVKEVINIRNNGAKNCEEPSVLSAALN